MTKSIEPYIRDEGPLGEDILAVRGGPLTVEKLLSQAEDEARRHVWRGRPFSAVSVFCAVDPWTVEVILADQLGTRSTYAAVPVGELRAAAFELLPTYDSPHFDVLLSEATEEAASTLLGVLGASERNPYRRRR